MPNPKLETYKNKATGDVYDYTDADAQGKLTAILDGTTIDSFSDVESALGGKVDVVTGKGLSTNDYDNTAKAIVDTAQDNINANTKLIKDTVGWSGKNKIWADYYDGKSKTLNGITATVNSDGSVTVNGTATGTFGFVIFQVRPSEFHKKFKVGDKCTILGCPANGSAFTYYLRLATDPWAILGDDYGESKEITITDQSSKTWVKLTIGIDSGQTMNNVTFYPMICDTNILDKTFESPFSSTAFPRSEQAVLGAKNVFDYINTPTYAYNASKTFITNGVKVQTTQATKYGNVYYAIPNVFKNKDMKFRFSVDYISGVAGILIRESDVINTEGATVASRLEITQDTEVTLSFNTGTKNYLILQLFASYNNTETGEVDYTNMMMWLASDPDDTYAPYAMTNRELTDAVQWKESVVSLVQGITSNGNKVIRTGNVVEVYLTIPMQDVTSADKVVGILPFKPANIFAFVDIFDSAKPYEIIGKALLRPSTNELVIPQGVQTSATNIFITGTYICTD